MSSCAPGTFRGTEFDGHWACLEVVRLYGATQLLRINLPTAVGAWDAALQDTEESLLPRFAPTSDPDSATTIVTGPNDGSAFCGSVDLPSNTFSIENETSPGCATQLNRGSLSDVLIHEMAHYWGWAGGSHPGHNNGVAGVSDHCTLALPSAGGLNTTICHHNIEGGVAAYGLRSLAGPSSFWSTPFVVSWSNASLPDTIRLVAGNSMVLQAGAFLKERGDTVSGNWLLESSAPGVATVSGRVVTAVAPGTAQITITPIESSGFYLTSAFAASDRIVPVKVTAPPPVNLAVLDIAFNDSLPITAAGTYQWTAVIGSGDATGVSYRWVFEYSDNTPPDSVFIPGRQAGDTLSPWIKPVVPGTSYVGAGQSVSQPVHLGSYNLRVKVWPIRGGVAGAPSSRDFPVCPPGEGDHLSDGGGDSAKRFTGRKSPPSTNAVEGCAQ